MRKSVLLSLVILLFSFLQAAPMLQPTKLTCEYLENPLGIDISKPRLSWNFIASGRNQFQSAYEIIVSNNPKEMIAGKGAIWQTGKVSSGQNINITFSGTVLKPFTRYYWRVKVYDAKGEASEWSALAFFETAMLQATDWTAEWISDGSKQFEKDEDFYKEDPMPLFRRQFSVSKKITS